MTRRLLALVPVGLVLVLAAWAAPASAATTGAVGWWTRSPLASAPEGGIAVGNAPDGPISVAAVEVDLDDGVSSATLSMNQAGGTAPGPGQLVVCVVAAGFAATTAGPIEEAPATTCDGTSAAVAVSGTTWTADVGELVGDRRGPVAFAIVPATGSTALWDLQLEAPAVQSTPASGSSSSSQPTSSSFSTPTTAPQRASAPSSFATPPPPAVRATPTSIASPPTTAAAVEEAPAEVALTGTRAADDGGPSGRPVGQAIFMASLAAAVGVIGGVAHKVITARAAA